MSVASVGSPLLPRLQQLHEQFGGIYDLYARAPSHRPRSKEAKHYHHERIRLQRAMVMDLDALYRSVVASSPVRMSAEEFQVLLELLPSWAVLSSFSTTEAPLLLIMARVLRPQSIDAPLPHVPDSVMQCVLLNLARLLHQTELWSKGDVPVELAIRTTGATLLGHLLQYFVASSEAAAVEEQWRAWQELANHTLLDNVRMWLMELEAARVGDKKSPLKTKSQTSVLSTTTLTALLCQWLRFVTVLAKHPCARSLDTESWARLLSSVVSVMGQPQDATTQLELTYTALHVLLGVQATGVVSPGVWGELTLQTVAKSVPHTNADAPVALPVSSLSDNNPNYASLFITYVRLVKALVFLQVEESPTSSNTARDTATQLHAILAGLAEMSTLVYVRDSPPDSGPGTAEARLSLLPAVVKELITVDEESQSSPRQYTRYVQGMLTGRTPLAPHIVTHLVRECQAQMAQLTFRSPTILCTDAHILQSVFIWSIHAIIDEGLLDVSRHTDVFATLAWNLYEAADTAVGKLTVNLAEVLLTNPMLCARKDVAMLAARIIACEGLALLLHLLLFIVIPCGITDQITWHPRYRQCLYAAEERVMRTVGAFDCGPPLVLSALGDALDQTSTLLGPMAAKVSALLPESKRPPLAPAGCQGALEKLMEVIPIF